MTSTRATGIARRLWNQPGSLVPPLFAAARTMESPSGKNWRSTVRSFPDRRPRNAELLHQVQFVDRVSGKQPAVADLLLYALANAFAGFHERKRPLPLVSICTMR